MRNMSKPVSKVSNNCVSQAVPEQNYPVMVFFYGGGFEVGAAYGYTAEYFLDEDVVFVVVQYRLGLFGEIRIIIPTIIKITIIIILYCHLRIMNSADKVLFANHQAKFTTHNNLN